MSLKAVWTNLMIGLMALNATADSAFISTPLQRTGVDRNASGWITINLGPARSSLVLQVSNLTAGRTYTLASGGMAQGRFVADRSGRGQLRFARPSMAGARPFNFDPLGRNLTVLDGSRAVLRARIDNEGEPAGSVADEDAVIPRVPGSAGGFAQAAYESLADGSRRFSIMLTNIGDEMFQVFVDGIRRGSIAVSGGSGQIAFDNDPTTPGRQLNFDPRGKVIDIARGAVLRFSGEFRPRSPGINLATPAVLVRFIPSTAGTASGFARVRRWVDRDGRRELDVELVNMPLDNYELYVNNVFQGFLPVVPAPFGSEGEIQFSTDPDDEDEHPLGFDAFNSFYMVQGVGGVVFQGKPEVLDLTDTNASTTMPREIELPLFNQGRDPDGTARGQLKVDDRGRRHFEVELRNVPNGDYSLTVDGTSLGTISVAANRGLIEFEDEPELGELPLNFDPLGRTIGVRRGDTLFLERVWPSTF